MSELKISYLNYPIYGIGSNEQYIVTSGGGGGKNYGIEDLLDVNVFNEKEKKLEVLWSTSEQGGVVDSIQYIRKYNLWIGSLRNECVLFEINEETGPHVLLSFVTDFSEKNPRQVVAKFSNQEDFILTGGDDKTLRLWKLKLSNDSTGVSIRLMNKNCKQSKEISSKSSFQSSKEGGDGSSNSGRTTVHAQSSDTVYLDPKNAIEHIGDFIGHDESIKDCDICLNDTVLATCSSDYSLRIWDVRNFANLCTQYMNNPKNKNDKLIFRSCKFLRRIISSKKFTYTLLTTASSIRGHSFLIIWEILFDDKKEKFSCVKQSVLWLDEKPCCNMTISSNEEYFAFGFSTGSLKLFNSKFSLLCHYKKHELPITAMCFTQNDKYLLTAGADYSISCANVHSFNTSFIKKLYKFSLYSIIFVIIIFILLDSFNVGYDLYLNDSIRHLFHTKNIVKSSVFNQAIDEL